MRKVTCFIILQKLFLVENVPPSKACGTVAVMIVPCLQVWFGFWFVGVFLQVRHYSRVVFLVGGIHTSSSIDQVKDLGFSSAPNVCMLVNLERIFAFCKTKKVWTKLDLLSIRYQNQ